MDVAANVYRVERDTDVPPAPKDIGIARLASGATHMAFPPMTPHFLATLHIVDQAGKVVYETTDSTRDIDYLEEEILEDLIHLDVASFRDKYGLPGDEPATPAP